MNARDSAKGEECTLHIASVCNYNPDTTVLCHIGFGADGTNKRNWPGESNAVYACSSCHDCIDRRSGEVSETDRWFYIARGLARTHKRRLEVGIDKDIKQTVGR